MPLFVTRVRGSPSCGVRTPGIHPLRLVLGSEPLGPTASEIDVEPVPWSRVAEAFGTSMHPLAQFHRLIRPQSADYQEVIDASPTPSSGADGRSGLLPAAVANGYIHLGFVEPFWNSADANAVLLECARRETSLSVNTGMRRW